MIFLPIEPFAGDLGMLILSVLHPAYSKSYHAPGVLVGQSFGIRGALRELFHEPFEDQRLSIRSFQRNGHGIRLERLGEVRLGEHHTAKEQTCQNKRESFFHTHLHLRVVFKTFPVLNPHPTSASWTESHGRIEGEIGLTRVQPVVLGDDWHIGFEPHRVLSLEGDRKSDLTFVAEPDTSDPFCVDRQRFQHE